MTTTLILGDCLEKMKDIPDKSIDICFTSPPYNRKRNDKYTHYDDIKDDYYQFLKNFVDICMQKTKRYIFLNVQTNYYNKSDVYHLIGTYADYIQQVFIWGKTNPLPASNKNITNAYEFFIVLGEEPLKSNETYTKNLIISSVNSSTTTKIHRAVMKQEICDWFIEKFTKENDVVLDPFMGLGTTGVACKKLNRNFIGIELDEHYFNIAKERIEKTEVQGVLI